jgi:hypothetical protein
MFSCSSIDRPARKLSISAEVKEEQRIKVAKEIRTKE